MTLVAFDAAGLLRLSARRRATAGRRSDFINVGWVCVAAALALSLMGIAAIGTVPRPDEPVYAMRHFIFMVVGMAAAVLVAVPHYQWFQRFSYPLLAFVVVLLIFVLVPFVPEWLVHPRNGARRWINLRVVDFQPSELAKIAYVLAIAKYLRFRKSYRRLVGLILPFCLTIPPLALILKEPDLGSALLFLPTLFAMLLAAGAKLRHLILIAVIGAAMAPVLYPLLEPHQKDRIRAMAAQLTGNTRYDDSIGFQQARAITLSASGGLLGAGKNRSAALVQHNRLPEEHNDMVFAVVCCRWGVAGAVVTWSLFAALCGGAFMIAAQCRDPFGRLVPIGLAAMLFSQMTINTGMTIGVLPITGVTLPFVSYGGSSLLSAWIMVGLLLNIAARRTRYMGKEAFHFDNDEDEAEAS